MKKLFPFAFQTLVLAAAVVLLSGCRIAQSELQRSEIKAAGTNAVCKDGEFKLSSSLTKVQRAGRKGFDLHGRVVVSATAGVVPDSVNIFQLSLKPGWKGWPGYFVMNATRRKGGWQMSGDNYGPDPNFTGTSRTENGGYVIEFIWYEQGLTGNPDHFAAYDVSVTFSDSTGKRHIIANMGVPAP
jgi:hypothetical protein